MSEKFTKESVNLIFENTKRISYNKGFLDGYKRGVEDAKDMVERLAGDEE